ncbi:unnamed protein product [Heterobilharzia americana]|nr:unnamed protein product [Heterobilharzia americana]CAH8487207.1 unnamed protein product [Heterobilharzia americana]
MQGVKQSNDQPNHTQTKYHILNIYTTPIASPPYEALMKLFSVTLKCLPVSTLTMKNNQCSKTFHLNTELVFLSSPQTQTSTNCILCMLIQTFTYQCVIRIQSNASKKISIPLSIHSSNGL